MPEVAQFFARGDVQFAFRECRGQPVAHAWVFSPHILGFEEQDPGVLGLPSQARDRRHRKRERPSSLGPTIVAVAVNVAAAQVSGGNIAPPAYTVVPEVTNPLI